METGRQAGSIDPNRVQQTIEEMLALARESLKMEVSFVSEFVDGRQVYRRVEGDAKSFGLQEGGGIPLEGSYCQRVIDGRLPGSVPDAKNDERVKYLTVTREAGIGSYVGVPLRRSDGGLYGTLCCISHAPNPWLREQDLKLMETYSRDMVRLIEREAAVEDEEVADRALIV